MLEWSYRLYPNDRPFMVLTACFFIWKALLISLAASSPGNGYDTSTNLLRSDRDTSESDARALSQILSKFVRWDAIYFTQISHRGILFEQEWAFGWGFKKLLNVSARGFSGHRLLAPLDAEALAGIIIAHSFHLLSCFVLYQLSWNICKAKTAHHRLKFAFLAAFLHIISPAGLFLSAPYAESAFSFFNFTGYYFYSKSLDQHLHGQIGNRDLLIQVSGLAFGVATTLRGNGLLSGALFCFEIIAELSRIRFPYDNAGQLRRLSAIAMGGVIMALCAILPQFLAYLDYCVNQIDSRERPWCSNTIPSIYAWVQSHYWQVGFLKYWTFSNLPLFILAWPMLCLMGYSALSAYQGTTLSRLRIMKHQNMAATNGTGNTDLIYDQGIAKRVAMPQLILAALALTSYHVQIITRLSSGYPLWYWWLASIIIDSHELDVFTRKWRPGKTIIRWMVMYALIQGGLFASFLPPA